MDQKSALPADWSNNTLNASISSEINEIIKALIAHTKTGKIKWEKTEDEDEHLITPCTNNDVKQFEAQIYNLKIKIVSKKLPDYHHRQMFITIQSDLDKKKDIVWQNTCVDCWVLLETVIEEQLCGKITPQLFFATKELKGVLMEMEVSDVS